MKTIPLKTLLGQITPLNWKPSYFGWKRIRGGNKPIADCQSHEDAMYIIHACNHFPELVAVAREYQTCAQRDWHVPQGLCDRMATILASAETVQIED